MSRLLVLFAHPNQSQSKVNVPMARVARETEGVTFVDLYAEYPRYKVDVGREQARLLEHDIIVMQFPFYWYSTPALLKEWQDLVLEFGFAYGSGGDKLAGKRLLPALTAGGAEHAYTTQGTNRFPIRTLLTPLEQTANLCQMHYLPPLVLFAALSASEDDRANTHVQHYRQVLEGLRDDTFDMNTLANNELFDLALLNR